MSRARKRQYDSTEQEADSSQFKSAVQRLSVEEKMATDQEIDEFYAILKRAQEARNWILGVKKENGGEVKREMWQPRFAPEDFNLENTGRDDSAMSTGAMIEKMVVAPVAAATGGGLDLNEIPDEACVDMPAPMKHAVSKKI